MRVGYLGPGGAVHGRGLTASGDRDEDELIALLVRCLSEFAFRGVNLTLIESRPRKQGLGHYMFFADLEGGESERPVREAVDAVRAQTEQCRVLGSYPSR